MAFLSALGGAASTAGATGAAATAPGIAAPVTPPVQTTTIGMEGGTAAVPPGGLDVGSLMKNLTQQQSGQQQQAMQPMDLLGRLRAMQAGSPQSVSAQPLDLIGSLKGLGR